MRDLELLEYLTFFLVLVSNIKFSSTIIENRPMGKRVVIFFGFSTLKGGVPPFFRSGQRPSYIIILHTIFLNITLEDRLRQRFSRRLT